MMKPMVLPFLIAAALAGTSGQVSAQRYPSKAVKVVVTVSAGGTPDTIGRVVAQKMSELFGQSVVIENRPGANGIIASQAVAASTPDGYTLLLATGSHAINPSIYRKLPYDSDRDFVPVAQIGSAPALTLVVNQAFPAKDLTEFITLAKTGKVSYGSAGVGSILHLAGARFNQAAGTKMLHVPYKGGGPALSAVLAGEVQAIFLSTPAAVPAIKAGSVRPLGVTSATRLAQFPDLPTLAEGGLPGFETDGGWVGIFAPAGTPAEVVERINSMVRKATHDPATKQKLLSYDFAPSEFSASEFKAFVARDTKKAAEIVRDSNIQVD